MRKEKIICSNSELFRKTEQWDKNKAADQEIQLSENTNKSGIIYTRRMIKKERVKKTKMTTNPNGG